jgi:hypothetical protein
MKLGTILLRDAVISLSQLEAGLRAQVLYGGRLGTNLVELGFIDVDRLGEYLSKVLNVPVASADRFEAAPPELLADFGSDLADLYTAFPLGANASAPRAIDVAIADPRDLLALEQLATQCGRPVVPHVAAELRILYYLEKHYGIVRKARFVREGDVGQIRGPDSERRRTQPAGGIVAPGKVRFEPRSRLDALRAIGPAIPRVAYLDTIAAIDAAKNRDAIADALVEHAVGRFGVCVVMFLRASNATGWRLFANGGIGAQDAVERLSLPLGGSSVLQAAHDSGRPYRGGPISAGRPVEKELWAAIGIQEEPSDMIVVPVVVKQRVVNLVYAHGVDGGPIRDEFADELYDLGAKAADAYMRLIRDAKTTALTDGS